VLGGVSGTWRRPPFQTVGHWGRGPISTGTANKPDKRSGRRRILHPLRPVAWLGEGALHPENDLERFLARGQPVITGGCAGLKQAKTAGPIELSGWGQRRDESLYTGSLKAELGKTGLGGDKRAGPSGVSVAFFQRWPEPRIRTFYIVCQQDQGAIPGGTTRPCGPQNKFVPDFPVS